MNPAQSRYAPGKFAVREGCAGWAAMSKKIAAPQQRCRW
jgi:hypothetical protein